MRNEIAYKKLINNILNNGKLIKGRNGDTLEVFGTQLKLDVSNNQFPMITGRKMFSRGIIGEFLAFIQTDCTHLTDFTDRGCNYWKLWADKDGNLDIDYPPGNQLYDIIEDIKSDPHSRRHIINLWNPQNLPSLSLPCCHYSYQFNIQNDKINMIWTQRSADTMIGVPSDMILATLYLHIVGMATGYKPNEIIMNFGSTLIYTEHLENVTEYLNAEIFKGPQIEIDDLPYTTLIHDNFLISEYNYSDPIKFLLKG